MVYTCDIFDESRLAEAVTCDVVVTNGIKLPESMIPHGMKIIDANKFRIEGSWHAYQKNELILQKLKKVVPQLFSYKGYDLYSAIRKSIFWTNFRQGYIEVALDKCGLRDHKVINGDSRGISGNVKDLIRTTWYAFKGGKEWVRSSREPSEMKVKYVFVIDSVLLIQFWDRLINQFAPEETGIFVLAEREEIPEKYFHDFLSKGISVFYEEAFSELKPPSFNPLLIPADCRVVLKNLLIVWSPIVNFLENILPFAESGVKAFILNAAENNFYGHILAQPRKKDGYKVFNTMNGNKFSTPNNSDAEFDRWFVWDEMLKNLLEKECQLPPGQVVNIGGHLMQDKIRSHRYLFSLPLSEHQLKNMKIISFGSCRDRRKDKVDVLHALYQWMRQNPDVLLLYRPHPAEKEEHYLLPKDELRERVILIKYSQDTIKETLYDQLRISQLMVAIGSTVLLEAKWAGIPAITFEQKETSFVYCVDDQYIYHCKNPDSFLDRVEELLSRPRTISLNQENQSVVKVAKDYADYIKQDSQTRMPNDE